MKNLTEKVEHCLAFYPETGKDDIKLLARIWMEYYGLPYDAVLVVMAEARPETIRRTRQKIQLKERQVVIA